MKLRPRGGSFVKFLYFREYRPGNSSSSRKGRPPTSPANHHATTLLVTNLSVVSTLEARRGSSMLAAWQNARGYVLAAGDATSARAWPFLCPNPMPVRSYEGRRGGAEGSGFLGGGRDVVTTV